MTEHDTPAPDPAVMASNLAVLHDSHPALATALKSTPAPAAVPALTRDGQLSFQLAQPDGHPTWLGRTSIPSVRARALIEQLDLGPGNVMLPGIGQGAEVDLFLARLPGHRAVFIWETQPATLGLILRLYDWSTQIARGRLVFIACQLDELTETLVNWLAEHPGHLCPERLMVWPWSTPPELAAIRSAVQNAYTDTDYRRTTRLADLRARLTDKPPASAPPLVAVLAPKPTEEAHLLAAGLADAAKTLGWQSVIATVTGPGDVHPLAQANKLATAGQRPTFAVLADYARQGARCLLPDEVPAVSWLGISAAPTMTPTGESDMLAVTHTRQQPWAATTAANTPRPLVLPLPCLTHSTEDPIPQADREDTALILADIHPTHASTLGFRLASHQRLWDAALRMLEEVVDGFTDDQAARLLSRAEAQTGVRLDDQNIRQAMLSGLCHPAATGLLWRKMAQHLTANKVPVDIHGTGWTPRPPLPQPQPCPSLSERARLLARARLFIYADPTGRIWPEILLAAAAGAVVVARAHPGDDAPGGLATLLAPGQELVTFRGTSELVTVVRRLLANPGRCQELADRARARVLAEHLPLHRLKALITASSSVFSAVPRLP